MPGIPDAAIQAVAGQMLGRYESQYDAAHLTWRDFADDARADLEAAAPLLADKIATAILRYADEHEPPTESGAYLARHRHFAAASAVAAKAFGRDILEAASGSSPAAPVKGES